MRITILGSGTAVPSWERFPSGVLVETCGLRILVDIGPGTLRRLAQVGVSPGEVDVVLLTHYHTDHTADLPALLFALRNPAFRGRKPLTVAAAAGLHRFVDTLSQAWPWLRPKDDGDYELRLVELEPGAMALGGPGGECTLHSVRIRHTAQSLGYRFVEPDGTTAAFSGDADECDELVELARDAGVFVCDCAFPDEERVDGHLTPSSCGEHARRAGVDLLVPTHFYPECERVDMEAQLRAAFDGRIAMARDLMVLEGGSHRFEAVTPPA